MRSQVSEGGDAEEALGVDRDVSDLPRPDVDRVKMDKRIDRFSPVMHDRYRIGVAGKNSDLDEVPLGCDVQALRVFRADVEVLGIT
jgi:hypothetical protein